MGTYDTSVSFACYPHSAKQPHEMHNCRGNFVPCACSGFDTLLQNRSQNAGSRAGAATMLVTESLGCTLNSYCTKHRVLMHAFECLLML
jgi:hypothetical protein